jgi:hypothetical protein
MVPGRKNTIPLSDWAFRERNHAGSHYALQRGVGSCMGNGHSQTAPACLKGANYESHGTLFDHLISERQHIG